MKYPDFHQKFQSLMAKFLTEPVFTQLQNITSEYGFTLDKLINSGLENPDSAIGVYAGDADCYRCFSPLLDPIIENYHGVIINKQHHSDFNANALTACNFEFDNHYIISTRIRVGRNLADMPLGPGLSKKQRFSVEQKIISALSTLSCSLAGHYYSLDKMGKQQQAQLIADHFLFKAGDKYLEAAGLNRDWPAGRGIYHNSQKNFLVWINEEDQLRIISMQAGGNIKEVFARLVKALTELEKKLNFARSERLGYISSCPTNLGTAMRASVHIKLPLLGQSMAEFRRICKRYHLQIRGVNGEHSQSKDGIYDVSNRRRLGVTEVQCVQDLCDGVNALIAREKELESR